MCVCVRARDFRNIFIHKHKFTVRSILTDILYKIMTDTCSIRPMCVSIYIYIYI